MTSHRGSILDLANSQVELTWNPNCHKEFSNLLITNEHLLGLVFKLGYKAALGIATVLTELVHQRLEKFYPHINVAQEFTPRIQSLWAGIIDPLYLKTYKFGFKYLDEKGCSLPYFSNWYILFNMTKGYIDGSGCIHQYLVNLSLLTRYLMPNKNLSDNWFSEIMDKTIETFPYLNDCEVLDGCEINYDCSNLAPIPQEFFFDSNFKYSEEGAKPVLNAFLQSLDYNNNPWLCTPEEMLAKGFKGEPYKV
ncbi:MAG: hypothetical protein FWH29_09045 [Methanobrevibacter sp.]|nr:hypothetical protein [Methanobrevibacter sp.]